MNIIIEVDPNIYGPKNSLLDHNVHALLTKQLVKLLIL